MLSRGRVAPALAGLLLAAGLAGCGADAQEAYCDAVTDHQAELSEAAGGTGSGRLFALLPALRDLRDQAPSDTEDEWALVVEQITAVEEALRAAGLDPAAYDAGEVAALPPERRRPIEAAARALGAPDTVRAMGDLEQQARDVCHTPLTLV